MQQFIGWSEAKLRYLKEHGRIRGFEETQKKASKKNSAKKQVRLQKRSKEKEWLGWNLMYWCNEHSVTLETEYKFHPEREWRFDYAIPALKIAIEYEGIFSDKSRHTTISGYAGDVEKYNAAQQLGYRVIRLTAMDYETVLEQLNGFVKGG